MKRTFAEEKDEIRKKIWNILNVQRGTKVLDIGVGEEAISTKAMIARGAHVTAVDKSLEPLVAHKGINAALVCADACNLPFTRSTFDLSLAFFSLHEIHQELHTRVINELAGISNYIAIAEPGPGDDELYIRYWNILDRACHTIGECEAYKDIAYWRACLERHYATVIQEKKISYQQKLVGDDAVDFFERIIEHLRKHGIAASFLDELKALTDEVETHGAMFSDISVLVARCP